jgi:hypothetical protein
MFEKLARWVLVVTPGARRCYRKHVKTLGVGICVLDMARLGTLLPSLQPSTRNLARQLHDVDDRPSVDRIFSRSLSWLAGRQAGSCLCWKLAALTHMHGNRETP